MRTSASSGLNSSPLGLPLKRAEKEQVSAARRKEKSSKTSLRGAREQEEALDLDDPVGRLDRRPDRGRR